MRNTRQHSFQGCFHDYIGLSYESYDCYELIQLFYKNLFNINLETLYLTRPDKQTTNKFIEDEKTEWLEVQEPKFGDIILIRINGLPCHVGIYINDSVFLHSRQKTGSCLERVNVWKNRIVGYYRWPELE